MELTETNVSQIWRTCLATKGENLQIEIHGVTFKTTFSKTRLIENASSIIGMIDQLPIQFFDDPKGGGGWTVDCMPLRLYGDRWTEVPLIAEQLLQLALAVGRAKYLTPRELWKVLPGGLPYIAFRRSTERPYYDAHEQA